jgi:predicted RNA-binding Zn-ribbon protein involved in translation (DUF1610 family)
MCLQVINGNRFFHFSCVMCGNAASEMLPPPSEAKFSDEQMRDFAINETYHRNSRCPLCGERLQVTAHLEFGGKGATFTVECDYDQISQLWRTPLPLGKQ